MHNSHFFPAFPPFTLFSAILFPLFRFRNSVSAFYPNAFRPVATVIMALAFFITCSFLPGDQQHASAQDDVNVDLDVVNMMLTVHTAVVHSHRDSRQKCAVI